MYHAHDDVGDMMGSRRGFRWICLSATLLASVSCSGGAIDGGDAEGDQMVLSPLSDHHHPGHCKHDHGHRGHHPGHCNGGAGGTSGGGGASAGGDSGGASAGGESGGASAGGESGGASAGGSGGASAGGESGGASAGGDSGGASAGGESGGASAGGSGGAVAGGGSGGTSTGGFTLSATMLYFTGCPSAQTVLISNTSDVPLTWHASGNLTSITVSPLGSTLAVGAAINMSVTPNLEVTNLSTVVSIDADAAPSQTIAISGFMFPSIAPPPDIDLGNVPLNVVQTAFIPISEFPAYPGVGIVSSNPDFLLSGFAPNSQSAGFGWDLTFRPEVLGPQQTTITFYANFSPACPPNSFIARGVGVAP